MLSYMIYLRRALTTCPLSCAGVGTLCFVIVVATNIRLLIENFLKCARCRTSIWVLSMRAA